MSLWTKACFRYILHVLFLQRSDFPLFLQIKTPGIVSSPLKWAANAGFKFFPAVSCQATATQIHLQEAGFVHCPLLNQGSKNSIQRSRLSGAGWIKPDESTQNGARGHVRPSTPCLSFHSRRSCYFAPGKKQSWNQLILVFPPPVAETLSVLSSVF